MFICICSSPPRKKKACAYTHTHARTHAHTHAHTPTHTHQKPNKKTDKTVNRQQMQICTENTIWLRDSCGKLKFPNNPHSSYILPGHCTGTTSGRERVVQELLSCAHRSRWSIGHQRPLTIVLCSGLLWSCSGILVNKLQSYIHTCIHTHTHLCVHAYTYTDITHTHTHTHTHIYIYIYIYIHTYIYVCKVSASRAEDPGFESRLRRDFFRVKSYQ